MSIKVIHIDDEANSLDLIKSIILDSYQGELDLIGSYQNVQEGILAVQELQPDMVLLDIEMKEMHGFEVAKLIADSPSIVVFLTGQVELVLEAIELSELPYILKPVRVVDFRNLIILYKNMQASNQESKLKQQIANAEQHVNSTSESALTSLFINSSNRIEIIHFDQICYLQSNGPISFVHTVDGHHHSSSKSLSFYEKILSLRTEFIRCHRSYIVNSNLITHLKKTKYSYQIVMNTGDSIDVSYLKKKEVYDFLIKRGSR
ncbi:MAG: response regulator transcription factor [Bacteroidetes bacterium]|nr:response regulator transcription factor [Bacteroidota bacterium]